MKTSLEIIEPTAEEAEALEQSRLKTTQIRRPTPAPFPWAENYKTVGVTGTNGKTSTTRLVAAAMEAPTRPVMCETTIGYEFRGAPVKVARTLHGYFGALARAARLGSRHAAIEVTSQALSRGYAKMWRFDIGVFTNLTQDHLAAHGSWEHYLASKAQLFVHLGPGGTAVFNAADPCSQLLDQVTAPDVHRLWYRVPSRGELTHTTDLAAREVEITLAGTRVVLEDSPLAAKFGGELRTQLLGEVFAENLLAAACASVAAGIDPEEVARNLAACPRPAGRFEVISETPIVAIDYAHTPDAMIRTCQTARTLAGKERLFVVFGAGGGADRDKREPMGRAVGESADEAFITNDNPRNEPPEAIAKVLAQGCRKGGRAHVQIILDRREAIFAAIQKARPGDCVLIAGKGHESTQTVGKVSTPFSDVAVAKEALMRRDSGAI
jgi:UDP-N-acetylmuramoyl-L-alanyl-D-glutamate--2,6-diaminopimelate ligase